jgi:ATP-dependent DNA helicase RecQ
MVYGFSDVVKLSRMLETTEASEDYKKIARHKLDAMLSLCESTQCRRKSLLNYFGQNAVAKCGNCDACLEPQDVWDATEEVQKILSAIYRTGQMFGASHVIDVIRGSQNAKVVSRGHNALSVYGIGKNLSKNEWNSILRQLLTMGFVKIKDWEFRSLALTEESRPLLRGEQRISLRKIRELVKTKTPSRAKPSVQKIVDSHDHPDLFEELRALRRQLASENKVPPYIIFGDKSLHEMCSLLPQNREQMLMVHGVGQSKFEKYGEVFIEVVNQYLSPR